MAKIYRTSDRIPVKIADMRVVISPLSFQQKAELSATITEKSPAEAARLSIKMAVKELHGVESMDGEPYGLQFDDTGVLSDSCVDDLMNMEHTAELITVALSLLNGIPQSFIDPSTGKPLEGVEIVQKGGSRKKKVATGS